MGLFDVLGKTGHVAYAGLLSSDALYRSVPAEITENAFVRVLCYRGTKLFAANSKVEGSRRTQIAPYACIGARTTRPGRGDVVLPTPPGAS